MYLWPFSLNGNLKNLSRINCLPLPKVKHSQAKLRNWQNVSITFFDHPVPPLQHALAGSCSLLHDNPMLVNQSNEDDLNSLANMFPGKDRNHNNLSLQDAIDELFSSIQHMSGKECL